MNIGVFDSGLGGLTILKGFLKKLPQYNYIYLGDNARVPYGNRSAQLIYQFTQEAVDFLVKKNCSLIIIACNTSTANALKKIQTEYLPKKYPQVKVLGVIRPTVEKVFEKKYQKIGVIATKATVNSNAFKKEIKKFLPKAIVYQQACPLLVPYIEDSEKDKRVLKLLLANYLKSIKNKIEVLILGCTHYEIIKDQIQKEVGKIKVISQSEIVAESLKKYLSNHPEIEKKLEKKGQVQYFLTDFSLDYQRLIKKFLGRYFPNKNIHKVKLI
ncbi:MAG: glutamate racemase [Microgenomates group bacterium]